MKFTFFSVFALVFFGLLTIVLEEEAAVFLAAAAAAAVGDGEYRSTSDSDSEEVNKLFFSEVFGFCGKRSFFLASCSLSYMTASSF